jgi:hypothetical protein
MGCSPPLTLPVAAPLMIQDSSPRHCQLLQDTHSSSSNSLHSCLRAGIHAPTAPPAASKAVPAAAGVTRCGPAAAAASPCCCRRRTEVIIMHGPRPGAAWLRPKQCKFLLERLQIIDREAEQRLLTGRGGST